MWQSGTITGLWIDNENTNAYFYLNGAWYHISSASPGSWPAMVSVASAAYVKGAFVSFLAVGNVGTDLDVLQIYSF
jgi:hypothetical protein